MRRCILHRIVVLMLAAWPVLAFGEALEKSADFRLPDANQKMVEVVMTDHIATVVCFLGTECPLAQLYAPRLSRLSEEFKDFHFIAVDSNRQDSLEDVSAYAKKHKLAFPVLKDHRNVVADQFGAKRTPEIFVIDQDSAIRYRGRIDDQYAPGLSKSKASRQDLRVAIEELLAGKPVTVVSTTPVGCLIGRVKEPVASSEVTYCGQVAGILQKNCVECHRQGEIGPFQLEEYDEVVGWADTIIEVIDDGRMPPWHANPDHGNFVNARMMSEEDKTLLRKWVEAGMPYGDAERLPPPAKHTKGWRLPHAPDLIVEMSKEEFEVPAEGVVDYQYFVVDPGFKEDQWITGAQIVPGNPAVVHHSIVYIRPPDGSRFRGIGWLSAYVPGSRAGSFPANSAVFVPAKSKLVFQQHYTPNGTAQSDMTSIGITFGKDDEITDEIYTLVGIDQEFDIPPHANNHKVNGSMRYLPPYAELLSIMPHMHLRGKSFRLFAQDGDERSILLDVPKYDFNWQHQYELNKPLRLSDIDNLDFEIAFDNSDQNPVNPNPSEHVTWGDQTFEEMAVAFFEVKEPRDRSSIVLKKREKKPAPDPAKKLAQIAAEGNRIIGNFDTDGDGIVSREETPISFRSNAFRQIDRNHDNRLTRQEIEDEAQRRLD